MARRYTAQETLEYLLQASDNEEFSIPDDTSDIEEDLEAEPDFQMTEDQPSEEDSGEEGPEGDPSFLSKNGEILWSSSPPPQTPGRARGEEIMRKTPGPTRYAISRAEDIKSTFELYFPSSIQNILVSMTNMEGNRVDWDQWRKVYWPEIEAYMGLLFLAGVFEITWRSNTQPVAWGDGKSNFSSNHASERFHQIVRCYTF